MAEPIPAQAEGPTPAQAEAPATAPAQAKAPAQTEAAAEEPPVYQFEDMRLKAGDRLQMQLPASVTQEKIIRVPFDYLHLSFPKDVQGLMVRKAPRVKTQIAAVIETSAGKVEAQVSNLSATGMLLHSVTALGAKGDELSVTLPLDLYDVKTELKLRGKIQAVSSAPIEGGGEQHRCGVEFLGLQPNETLILQSVVHHELAKNPYSVV